MNYEKIVTLYDTSEHAEGARHSLEAAGFPPSDISMVTKKTLGRPCLGRGARRSRRRRPTTATPPVGADYGFPQ
jgi:hypothetical protein